MAITNFTVEFSLLSNQDDGIDVGTDSDLIPLVGRVDFTPVFRDHRPILAPTYSPKSGFMLRAQTGYMDSDGLLHAYQGGPEGVRLPCNDAVFELDSLYWDVKFTLTTPLGEQVRVDGGSFRAPDDEDVTINLADVLQPTGAVSVAEALNAVRVDQALAAAAPAIINADLADRDLAFTDAGGGNVQFTLGGEALGDAVAIPGAVWSNLTGTPSDVVNAGVRDRDALRRARPGIPRRVFAPGNLGWLDDVINVFYDGHKFFTDFDVTSYRHTGTKWYSDRVNGANTNSGLGTTLTTALVKGTAVTTLSVAALSAEFPSGSKIVIADQDAAGTWWSMVATLSGTASAGATSISVNSVTPDFDYSFGSLVANPFGDVFKAYRSAAAEDQLVPLDRSTNAFGGRLDRSGGWGFGEMTVATTGTTSSNLSTGSPITSIATTALTVAVGAGSNITLTSGDYLQTFAVSSTASVGATSISVTSQEPNYAFPAGTSIKYGNRIAKSITIAPQFPNEVTLFAGDWNGSGGASTWTIKGGTTNVYTVTRSTATRVIDTGVGDYGMVYTQVSDAAACDALPGSFYISGSEVGVHYIAGGSPDAKRIHVLMASEITTLRNENGAMSVYLEGFTIIGGSQGNVWAENTGMGDLDLYCKDMRFLYSAGTSGNADSVNADGVRYAFFDNCQATGSPKDGLNYASRDRASVLRNAPKFIELNCESWAHGIDNPIAGYEDTNNASTAHEGAQGLRLNCVYHETSGAVVADVQTGTETWNVGCDAYDSLADSSILQIGMDAQQSGSTMHIWQCRVWGNAFYDIVQRTGTTVNVYDSEYDTSYGTSNTVESV